MSKNIPKISAKYDHAKIEKKWQKIWDTKKVFKTTESVKKKKCYVLDMFPYPSGQGLHVGHPRGYIASDVYSRFMRMQGFNVLHPMGFDTFGLPTEQYAIANKIHPEVATKKNVATYRKQLELIGLSYDWSREVETSDPKFYKWTQWIFLKLYNSWYNKTKQKAQSIDELVKIFEKSGNEKVHAATDSDIKIFSAKEWCASSELEKQNILMKYRLAYEGYSEVNWCPEMGTVLANDEVVGGPNGTQVSERGGYPVVKKSLRQWFLRITAYADRLIDGLDTVEWSHHIKEIQRNWIGRSVGSEIDFKIKIPEKTTEIRSYIMGIGNITDDLKKIGINIKTITAKGSYEVVIPKESISAYENLIQEKLKPGFWNEYLGEETVFIFKDKTGKVNRFVWDESDESDLLELCREYAKADFKNIRSMLEENSWYTGHIKNNLKITVFTTRADTLFGVTYVVLAPEAKLVQKLIHSVSNKAEVEAYIKQIKDKTDEDRTNATKEKTGVELKGIKAINPANGEEVPVWIADYVLAGYGTGMVMAVPAHDARDFTFAKKYNLPIKQVIAPFFVDPDNKPQEGKTWSPRKNVQAIIKHPTEDKIVQLRWKKVPWKTLVIGGVEDGETFEQAIRREIKEETGFQHIKSVQKICWEMESHFYASHKDINRKAFTQVFVVELEDIQKKDLSGEEAEKHEVTWVPTSDLEKTFWPISELPEISAHFRKGKHAFVDDGKIINSAGFDGIDSEEARIKITEAVGGRLVTKYKMRDAVFARQRYWGEPIPLIHKKDGTIVALKDKQLPLKLPNVKSYEPIGTGESPLAGVKAWVKAGYETNTMPGWAGSSWYYLRYMDPKNNARFASEKSIKYWKQVDMYVGGAEHATGHLLYSRFWNKFLHDLGYSVVEEPFKVLKNQGMVLGTDSRKMSKRWGNVVNPDEVVKNVGADTLRIYESFMGPFEQEIPWSTDSMVGSRRFIERVWKLQEKIAPKTKDNEDVILLLNQTIKKVEDDIRSFNANTAISALMILSNLLEAQEAISKEAYLTFVKILSPFAPHVAEEIWAHTGNKKMLVMEMWPKYDKNNLVSSKVNIAVQINGKVRSAILIQLDAPQEAVEKRALAEGDIVKWFEGREIRKVIFVKNKIINFVV
jgi:leucyl-tRNA synthetase